MLKDAFYVLYCTLIASCYADSIDSSKTVKRVDIEQSSINEYRSSESVYETEYKILEPIIGWSRYSGDCARSISGWKRWWIYTRLKKPLMMKWLNGLHMRIYPSNEVYRSLFVRGVYDPNLLVAVTSLLKEGDVLVDVGANMGMFSLLAAKHVGEQGRVLAVEPSSRDFERLVENVKLNNLEHIITTTRCSISDKAGKVQIAIAAEERSGLNTIGREFSSKGVEKISIEDVDSQTIDQLVLSENLHRLDVLKLDVEGSEVLALKGAYLTIKTFRPAIILGSNENTLEACGSNISELANIINDINYKAYRIVEDLNNFCLEEVHDIQNIKDNVIICLHESVTPPKLLQPKKLDFHEQLDRFFQ